MKKLSKILISYGCIVVNVIILNVLIINIYILKYFDVTI